MKKTYLFLLFALFSAMTFAKSKPKAAGIYELRIYHCEAGKLPDLLNRFKNHTTALFEKHGMQNLGYWVPTKENNNDLYYVLGYPNKEAREASWKAFMADPDWKEVWKKSEEAGKIVASIETKFMKLNPELTKKINAKKKGQVQLFEMRTYYCLPDKYPNIVARFRDHTLKLFKNHGMQNIMYFETIEKEGTQPTLLYFITHKSAEAAKTSWDEFRKDPNWVKVRDESEKTGKIVEKVESVYMIATDFSKIK
jgi:hypothetical protein